MLSSYQFQRTVDALSQVLVSAYPAGTALHAYFRASPTLGHQDRHLISDYVYGVLRHQLWLQWHTEERSPLAWLHAYCTLAESGFKRTLIENAAERPPLPVIAELPSWVVEQLSPTLSADQICTLGYSFAQPAPLDLRVNTLKMSRVMALAHLKQSGLSVTPTPYSPIGLRLDHKVSLSRHPLYTAGAIEVQDEGSQLLGWLVGPKRRETVVDFCAGAGGKTLLLGALMASSGCLYAYDISQKRLQQLRLRLKRSGLSNAYPQTIADENDARLKRLFGKIDRVLVDAPCSSLGTLRRNPDIKNRQSQQALDALTEQQARILAAAARLLKPGGRLVYATCSILPAENQHQVEHFLDTHPHFTLKDADDVLAEQGIPLRTGPLFQIDPHHQGTDGFFAAVFVRSQSS